MSPPQARDPQRHARELAELNRQLFGSDSSEGEGEVVEENDNKRQRNILDGEEDREASDDDEFKTVAYGLPDEQEQRDMDIDESLAVVDDNDGVEEENEGEEWTVKEEEDSDAAMARELWKQLNSRSGGRVRERPRRMRAGGSANPWGKANRPVEEE